MNVVMPCSASWARAYARIVAAPRGEHVVAAVGEVVERPLQALAPLGGAGPGVDHEMVDIGECVEVDEPRHDQGITQVALFVDSAS